MIYFLAREKKSAEILDGNELVKSPERASMIKRLSLANYI